MTKREAAIVSAYTGYLIGEFSDFHDYAEEIIGRPIFTHELPMIADELKEKSKKDFMSIEIEKSEIPEWIYHNPVECCDTTNFDAIEKALGFRLFGWQKSYIFHQGFRRMGRTTAEILYMLFNPEKYDDPIDFSESPRNKRIVIFRQQFRDIWEKLRDAGFDIRPVFWSKEDKKKYEIESMNKFDPYKYARTWLDEYEKGECPDCNNCKHLEFTEDDQEFLNKIYGGGYRGDHGHMCEYYKKPAYHRANSARHNPYIYPCDECYKDKFINYVKRDKKGE